METITNAWKLTPINSNRLFEEASQPVYVVQYRDGTGNIIMGGKPSLVAGVAFNHEPEDFLATCTPFYRVTKVEPSQVQ